MFADTIGTMEEEHHIPVDPNVPPVKHAPRKVPVAVRRKLEEKLVMLEQKGVLEKVIHPTPWISSMVVVEKKNGDLRICLDPRDLNQAIQREHYPLPTIKEIATRLEGAKVFTVLDVRCGFWHVPLSEESSDLTTFNTLFGRYKWKRMPFGISSAPEVFQRQMHTFIEGLAGCEVVADDLLVVVHGTTMTEAEKDHDHNLLSLLERCQQESLRLNWEKLKLRQTEVSFIGHVATSQGLKADPAKVSAVENMSCRHVRFDLLLMCSSLSFKRGDVTVCI